MADVSSPAIAQSYKDVRTDNGPINWFLLGYKDNKTIDVVGSGSGGISELASNLKDDDVFYGYARVTRKDDETTRTKFVFITFKGDNAPVMRKGKMSVHIANVKSVIKDFNMEIGTADISDLSEEEVDKKLKKANY